MSCYNRIFISATFIIVIYRNVVKLAELLIQSKKQLPQDFQVISSNIVMNDSAVVQGIRVFK